MTESAQDDAQNLEAGHCGGPGGQLAGEQGVAADGPAVHAAASKPAVSRVHMALKPRQEKGVTLQILSTTPAPPWCL